ncbi:hypothetical protein [Marivirga atlantica]|uniref:DUF1735 domain-containing protein n=1 Tax=Marivirga atlantica TaxID=1548457 RepID=A0A937DKB3_9BACT|nr:hypothetical protein [Marivirga atlantica]MBL0766760.1 hypothetical protein [Marivirga atlantica]
MKKLIYAIATVFVLASCEDVADPLAGVEQTDLFVQFGANTPDSTALAEGSNFPQAVTIQAPISGGEDLLASLSFEGTAVYGTDFTISSEYLESVDENGAVIRIPFLPAKPNEFVTDQAEFTISFPENFVQDGTKELTVTLNGATGVESAGLSFAGGRGSIRKEFYVEISDNDCGDLAGLYAVDGDVLVSDLGPVTYSYEEALGLADCTVEGSYPLVDITGGLWGIGYADLYGASARNAIITIDPSSNEITWGTVSDQFGGLIVQDATQPTSNYDPNANTITIYWEATGYGERGVTTYTLQ